MTLGRGLRAWIAPILAILFAMGMAGGAGAGRGGHGGFERGLPVVSAPDAAAAPTTPAPDWAAQIYAKIQEENDKILTTQGQLADAQDRLANLTGLMVGVGLALVVMFAGILFLMWRAARASTSAARALPILERAYVFLGQDTSLTLPDALGSSASVRVRFNVAFANHGRTPAVVRWVNLNHQYLSEPPDGVYEEHERHGVGLVIGAGQSEIFPDRDLILPRSEWEKAKAGEGGVYLHGRVVYQDIFSAPRETYFCRRYDIARRAFTVVESEALNRYD
jgi:uncharacterized membrane protein YciS (DUF1049 family)